MGRLSGVSFPATVFTGVCVVTLCVGPSGAALGNEAHATSLDAADTLDETGWLSASTGMLVVDAVEVGDEQYIPGFDPVPALTIGWSWRIWSFDLGAVVAHLPGSRSSTIDDLPLRFGDQVMIAAMIRSRFFERAWGGFYSRFSPGVGIYSTTETFRGAVAQREGLAAPSDVAEVGMGLSYLLSSGCFVKLSTRTFFTVELGVVGTIGKLELDGEREDYERYRGFARAGLEWRL